jgi:hypothetical protein
LNHDRIVTQGIVEEVRRDIHDGGLNLAIEHLIHIEPDLWDSIVLGSRQINELLVKAGIAETMRNDIYVMARWTAVVASEALRRGHYRLWCRTQIGTLLEQMDPKLKEMGGSQ